MPLILQLILIAMAVTACATPSTSQPTADTPSRTTPPTATLAGGSIAVPSTATPTATRSSVQDAIAYPDGAGLDRLERYTLTLRLTFKGTRDGQSIDSTDAYTRTYSREPAVQFTTIETTGPDNKPLKMLYGSVGQVQYSQMGTDHPCTAQLSQNPDSQAPFFPAQALRPARRGSFVGNETINGVSTRHYALDTASFSAGPAKGIRGDIWIRDGGDLVVKYVLRTTGDEAYFGKGAQGEQTTSFELADINAKQDVMIPTGCPVAFSDLPAMPDGKQLVRTPTGLSYVTASAMNQVISFYQEKMTALGWVLDSSSNAVPAHNFMIFALAKENKHAYVTLNVVGSNIQVDLTVEQD